MNVLIACEESQTVCKAFRERGHRAFSCDLQECSGGYPEWHIQGDCLPLLNGNCTFQTSDACFHSQIGQWDLVIAHPPCTYLTPAGASNIPKHPERIILGERAADFFMCFVELAEKNSVRVCIENPPPMKRFNLPKYTQIVRPWMFGDVNNKPTALWLYGLPNLIPTDIVEHQGEMVRWIYKKPVKRRAVPSGITLILQIILSTEAKLFLVSPQLWQTNGATNTPQ